jgi:predicted DNA-binding WGR domain protein
MSDWNVHLVLIKDKSRKFWRARVDGTQLEINYGRIGTKGQTQLKEFDSEERCRKEMDKVAASKIKKGYWEEGGQDAESAPAEAAPVEVAGPQVADMALDAGGRKVELRLSSDGELVRTVVVERHATPAAAAAAFSRLVQAMKEEGYTSVKARDDL